MKRGGNNNNNANAKLQNKRIKNVSDKTRNDVFFKGMSNNAKPQKELKPIEKDESEFNSKMIEDIEEINITEISSIDTFIHTNWIIHGVVSEKKVLSCRSGNFVVFFLTDKKGSEIKCISFDKNVVDWVTESLENGESCYVKRSTVKNSNSLYNNRTKFEISIYSLDCISKSKNPVQPIIIETVPSFDDVKSIADLNELFIGEKVTVMGIVVSDSGKVDVKTKNTIVSKKVIGIMDDTRYKIEVIFWGDYANLELQINSVLFLENVLVKEFNGINLNYTNNSKYFVNPDNERVTQLINWFNSQKENDSISSNNLYRSLPIKFDESLLSFNDMKSIEEINELELETMV